MVPTSRQNPQAVISLAMLEESPSDVDRHPPPSSDNDSDYTDHRTVSIQIHYRFMGYDSETFVNIGWSEA